MVASPGCQKICRFNEVAVDQSFGSSKTNADYIKVDDISGKRINDLYGRDDEIGLFEKSELVYIGIHDPRVIY